MSDSVFRYSCAHRDTHQCMFMRWFEHRKGPMTTCTVHLGRNRGIEDFELPTVHWSSNHAIEAPRNAWFPPFRCRSSVTVSPFCRCKIPLFCKNYVRKFRSVTAVNSKKLRNGSGNGNSVRKRQRLTGTEKRQRKNGNGMVETRHNIEVTE